MIDRPTARACDIPWISYVRSDFGSEIWRWEKWLASTLGDGKPASGEAKALLARAARIRDAASSSGRTLSSAAQTAWDSVESGVQKVAVAVDLPARLP